MLVTWIDYAVAQAPKEEVSCNLGVIAVVGSRLLKSSGEPEKNHHNIFERIAILAGGR